MRRYLIYMLLGCLLGGCAPQPTSHEPTIYVSILPLKSLVEAITDNDFQVEVLVPPGASPETFEPTPRQLIAINEAQWVFQVGLIDFETTLLNRIKEQHRMIALHHGINLISGTCSHHHHSHGEHHSHGIDPHIWTSPRALKLMAETIYQTIHTALPDSLRYTENHARLQARLTALDEAIAAQIEESGIREFIVYHPALTYYAQDYGLQQRAIEQEGKEPSARQLKILIEEARKEGVRTILYQRQFPRSTVETIASDIGAEAVEFDPLAEDIISNIEVITRLITRQ